MGLVVEVGVKLVRVVVLVGLAVTVVVVVLVGVMVKVVVDMNVDEGVLVCPGASRVASRVVLKSES
ncbi:hypothetical protein BJ508DRAFT_414437 [Ascobolus immersus RN42]|uniref:Transmembrane protein n=1 Tax=Ascobolus immersus RN42 TaxID=1160509 RepID=A0A3N4IBD0_ASCIM|nr:hypothetical protein BJ508DRAFT_414437 [Ascobolus immersus RN42]